MSLGSFEFHIFRAGAWPSDPEQQTAQLDELDHDDWMQLPRQAAASRRDQGLLDAPIDLDTRFGRRRYWVVPRPNAATMVVREAPTGVLFLSASLQALRCTIKATFHYAFSGRYFGTAYFPQSRKILTALDLGYLAMGIAERHRVMEGARQKLWLLLEGREIRGSAGLARGPCG